MSRAAIAAEGMTLEPGQSIRMVCPFCGGGSSGERSMSIKLSEENGLLLYHCFRANCPAAGVIGSTGVVRTTISTRPAWEPWDCSGFDTFISDEGMVKLAAWRVSAIASGVLWDQLTRRLALPVYGPREDLRGYVLRAVDDRRPKTLSARLRNDVPFQHWTRSNLYKPAQPGRIYVVEDIPSAERLRYAGRQAVALLGCTPSDEALSEIAHEARRRGGCELAIALDADATQQALRLQRQYGMRGSSRVLVLPKDIKDMTDSEVSEWLNANS